jgi:transcriptional regulator with XRE-family HTH domain
MNFSQLQERIRTELLRRIDRGTLSVSLLARQTGLGQPHLSNFLHARRSLSFAALDKILAAQHLTVADLVPERRASRDIVSTDQQSDLVEILIVNPSTALHEPFPRASSARGILPVLSAFLAGLKPDAKTARLQWDRYLAIRLPDADVAPMHPLLTPNSLLLLDRHVNVLRSHLSSITLPAIQAEPPPNLYAIRDGADLKIRYASLTRGRILLRPHNLNHPIEIPEPAPGETYHDLIAGRIVLTLRPS